MRRSTRWAWGLLALTVLLAGCKLKRVEDEKSISLSGKGAKGILTANAPPKDMEITVTATTSPSTPVTLYLVLESDALDVETDLQLGREPASSKVLAKSTAGESPTLQGTIPAGKECTVDVANTSGTATEVKAKIVGKY